MNEIRNDKNLQEAVSRREQKLPPMPADLNERLMLRLEEQKAPVAKPRRLWLYAAIAVAASIALLIVFNFGQEQTPQEPVVAQQMSHGDGPSDTSSTNEEPDSTDAPVMTDAPVYQKNRLRETRPRETKEVMQLVELIPTSEAAPDNVNELPASLIAKVEAYDQPSDPSRTTGIDDTDPLVAMAAHVEDIRQRGQRLQQEIEERIEELKN